MHFSALSRAVGRSKIRGGTSSNVKGIICPLIKIGLTDPAKLERGGGGSDGLAKSQSLPYCRTASYELTSFTETRASS